MKPGTVDLVLVHPPEWARIRYFSELGALANHALTEDGVMVVAVVATGALPDMLDRLTREGPEFIAEFSLLFPAPIGELGDPHYTEIRRAALLAGSGYCGGTRKRRLNRGRNCSSTLLASSILLAPASRSSVTRRSWKVSAIRSTLPLAWGERANIIWIPSSSMARLNWVGIPGRPEPGVCLKTPCRSVYRARGMPRRCKRRWISRK